MTRPDGSRATAAVERCVFVCGGDWDADDYSDDDDKLDGTTTTTMTRVPRALPYRAVLGSALEWGAT
jgi:hypothetical protein